MNRIYLNKTPNSIHLLFPLKVYGKLVGEVEGRTGPLQAWANLFRADGSMSSNLNHQFCQVCVLVFLCCSQNLELELRAVLYTHLRFWSF